MSRTVIFPIVAMVLCGAAGVGAALTIGSRLGRALSFRALLVLNYVLVSVVSGIVHLSDAEGRNRGYFDVLTADAHALTVSAVGTLVGLIALCVSVSWRLPDRNAAVQPELTRWDMGTLSISALALTPLAIIAGSQIQQYVAALNTPRVITVDQGLARYAFVSNWGVWAISFAALVLLGTRLGRSTVASLVVIAGATLASTATLAWTGGRSVIVVMTLPLLLLTIHRLRGIRWLVVPGAIVAGILYINAITAARVAGFGTSSSPLTWLDWEWGRFSMLGFAADYTEQHGYLWGETFVASGSNILLGILRLIGIPVNNPELLEMPDIAGQYILGTADTYVVSGLNSELYINFGFAGIIVGMSVLGLLTGWVDDRFHSAGNAILKFAWAYVGTLLVFRTLAADSYSTGVYLLYTGLPVLAVGIVTAIRRRAKSVGALRNLTPNRHLGDIRTSLPKTEPLQGR